MQSKLFQAIVVLVLSSSALAQSHVIITEIMYNPASKENKGESEWVEIANVGTEAVTIKDWRLDDEDKQDWGKFSCTLAPGGIAVLINGDAVKEEQFRAAWDAGSDSADPAAKLNYQVFAVKWGGLANSPAEDNEVLQLKDDKDVVVCEVKQKGKWPVCKAPDGPSVYLTDLKATDFGNGAIWNRSEAGKDGVRKNTKTELFDSEDLGSPGYVPGLNGTPVATPVPPAEGRKPKKPKEGAAPADKPVDAPGDGKSKKEGETIKY